MLKLKILLPILLLLALGLAAYFYFQPSEKKQVENLTVPVERGDFVITVTATGELDAKNSVKIRGPQGMRAAGIYETTISDLVTEGSVLEKGDYVASLDRTELAGKMSDVQAEIDQVKTQLAQAKIDTAIELRDLRDQLVNLEFTKEEKQLTLEQNKYEPESVKQQARLDLEKAERDYRQLKKKYELKKEQADAQVEEILGLLRQNQSQLDRLAKLSEQFKIRAPESGMLVYARSWRGKKEPGSRLTAWDPIVAELPDLSDMISTTYVNEVDISKVSEGQDVTIQIDAFPDNKYQGQVIKVANIGEQLRGYDAKVFEVIVQLNEVDSIMRPAMTTSNEIVTNIYQEVISVPIEALQTDSLTYVYLNRKGKKLRKEVIPGASNDQGIIIEYGLEEGDDVYLTIPEGGKDLPLQTIPAEVKEEVKARMKKEKRERKQEAMRRKEKARQVKLPKGKSGGGKSGAVIISK